MIEKNLTKLLHQVKKDKSLDKNQKKLLCVGITIGRYSSYYHIYKGSKNVRFLDVILSDISQGFLRLV